MADTAHVLRVSRVSAGPMIHLDLLSALRNTVLGLPKGIHEDIDGALGGDLGIAVKYRHPQHHRRAATFLLLLLERRQRRLLPLLILRVLVAASHRRHRTEQFIDSTVETRILICSRRCHIRTPNRATEFQEVAPGSRVSENSNQRTFALT